MVRKSVKQITHIHDVELYMLSQGTILVGIYWWILWSHMSSWGPLTSIDPVNDGDILMSHYSQNIILNSLWLSDAIWRHTSGSILIPIIACWLKAPSHYLDQCWLLISEVPWHSPKSNFWAIVLFKEFKNYTFTTIFPWGQWVNNIPLGPIMP